MIGTSCLGQWRTISRQSKATRSGISETTHRERYHREQMILKLKLDSSGQFDKNNGQNWAKGFKQLKRANILKTFAPTYKPERFSSALINKGRSVSGTASRVCEARIRWRDVRLPTEKINLGFAAGFFQLVEERLVLVPESREKWSTLRFDLDWRHHSTI